MKMYLSCMEPNPGCMRCTSLLFAFSAQTLLFDTEDSSFSETAPNGISLRLFPSHVHVSPEAWQKTHLYLGKQLLGCLHLITSVTPKISILLPETGNFASRNTIPVPEQGKYLEMKTPWIWCGREEVNFRVHWPATKEIQRINGSNTSAFF